MEILEERRCNPDKFRRDHYCGRQSAPFKTVHRTGKAGESQHLPGITALAGFFRFCFGSKE